MLNKQGKNKIDWCNFSWNPIKGRCLYKCSYCYVQRYFDRFHLEEKIRLDDKTLNCTFPKKPSKIFVGSTHDIFGEWIPDNWIYFIIKKAEENPQHIFIFLTKNPKRYQNFRFPDNCWLGTTIENNKTISRIKELISIKNNILFVSFEPLLEDIIKIKLDNIDWIIIGANSNPDAIKPSDGWAKKLIDIAKVLHIPIWVKDNYKYNQKIKEFPK